jgi:hypothetical protein
LVREPVGSGSEGILRAFTLVNGTVIWRAVGLGCGRSSRRSRVHGSRGSRSARPRRPESSDGLKLLCRIFSSDGFDRGLLFCGQDAQHTARVFSGDRSETLGFRLLRRELGSEFRCLLLGRFVGFFDSLRCLNCLGRSRTLRSAARSACSKRGLSQVGSCSDCAGAGVGAGLGGF